MKNLFLLLLLTIARTTCVQAQDFIPAQDAIIRLEAERELLKQYDGVDPKAEKSYWTQEELYHTMQREAVVDLLAVYRHHPNNKAVLDEYLINDYLINSPYVEETTRERLVVYLWGILAVNEEDRRK